MNVSTTGMLAAHRLASLQLAVNSLLIVRSQGSARWAELTTT